MSITTNLECLFKTSNYSKKKKKVKKKSEKSLRPSNYLSILIPLNTNQNIKHIKQKSARNWTLQNNLRTYRVNAWFSLDSIVPGQLQSRRAWLFVTPWTAACQASLSSRLSELTRIRLHWIGDTIQPSHPLPLPSFAFSLSQHQGLLYLVSSSHQVAEVMELQFQHQSFQGIFRVDFL